MLFTETLEAEEHYSESEIAEENKSPRKFPGINFFEYRMKQINRLGDISMMPSLVTELDCEYSMKSLLREFKKEEKKGKKLDKKL